MDTRETNCWVVSESNLKPLSQTIPDWPNRFKVAFQKKAHTYRYIQTTIIVKGMLKCVWCRYDSST